MEEKKKKSNKGPRTQRVQEVQPTRGGTVGKAKGIKKMGDQGRLEGVSHIVKG